MSSLSIFQAWTSRFPQSELPAAWEEDVRANLSKHRTKVIILSFIIVVDMVIVILVIQVNLSKHRTKVMISSRQGGNHNHCNCHPHYQSHWYWTKVFDLCFYHCLKVSVNVIITIIINIMIIMIINTTASPPGWLVLQTRADVAVRNRRLPQPIAASIRPHTQTISNKYLFSTSSNQGPNNSLENLGKGDIKGT